jgi:hypothetical protein
MMDEQSLSYYFAIYKNQLIQRGVYGQLTAGKSIPPAAAAASSSASTAVTPSPLPPYAVSEWSYIEPCYNYVPWHRYWLTGDEVPYVFHFFSTKPWVLDRNTWLDIEAWWELVKDPTIPQQHRDDLRAIFPAAMLALPKNEGCCWCRLTEESFMTTADGSWKQHNVFDQNGQLACPVMKAGHEKHERRRLEAANKAPADETDTK